MGGVCGRRETAVDESRKETADRVGTRRVPDRLRYIKLAYSILLVPQTAAAAAAAKVLLLCFGFPVC